MKAFILLFSTCWFLSAAAQDYQGWCTPEKAAAITNLIRSERPLLCVDLGTFGGATLSIIAKALKTNNAGIVYGIDAWSNTEAARGFHPGTELYDWWSTVNMNQVFHGLLWQLHKDSLADFCKLYKMTTAEALSLFPNESIDLLHIDANHGENGFFFDVFYYYPKVKNNGYILLNDAHWISARKSVIYLLENCELCIPYHESMTYLLFKKDSQTRRIADQLWR
jgi:hypothetical protein